MRIVYLLLIPWLTQAAGPAVEHEKLICRTVLAGWVNPIPISDVRPVHPLETRAARGNMNSEFRRTRISGLLTRIFGFKWTVKLDGSNLSDWRKPGSRPHDYDEREVLLPVARELAKDGGELLMLEMNSIGKFYINGSRPIILFGEFADPALLKHEMAHFEDWRAERDRLMKTGLSKRQAAKRAAESLSIGDGNLKTEEHAMSIQIEEWLRVDESSNFTFQTVLAAKIYPSLQAIIALVRNKRHAQKSLWFALTTTAGNREEYFRRTDQQISQTVAKSFDYFDTIKTELLWRLDDAISTLPVGEKDLLKDLFVMRSELVAISLFDFGVLGPSLQSASREIQMQVKKYLVNRP